MGDNVEDVGDRFVELLKYTREGLVEERVDCFGTHSEVAVEDVVLNQDLPV